MIVERFTYNVKRGCMQEAMALCKSFAESAGRTVRIYAPRIGPLGTLVVDTEFEGLVDREKFWAEWAPKPDSAALLEKWRAVTERGGTCEIWNLVD